MSEQKKFGLIVPKKAAVLKTQVSSIFNDESDDEPEARKRPRIPQKKMTKKSFKTESDIDPSIYEYDSIYDEMKTKQAESKGPKEVKKSRYIETLLKAADKRKKEHERRIDRKIQIEREKEGDQFKDKEEYVTSSYKKKLQEKEEEEERERRENMLNDMMDVTKQKDLSGFYRHFLNQTVGEEKIPLFGEKQIKKEVESDEDLSSKKDDKNLSSKKDDKSLSSKEDDENLDRDSDGIEIDNEDDDSERDFSDNKKSSDPEKKETTFKKRTNRDRKKVYRKKSVDSVPENLGKSKSRKRDEALTKKRDISSNSDASLSENENNEATSSSYSDKNKAKSRSKTDKVDQRHDSSSSDDESSNESASVDVQTTLSKEEKQKNIYAKRTVGEVFAEAQARYFQRMAMRNS